MKLDQSRSGFCSELKPSLDLICVGAAMGNDTRQPRDNGVFRSPNNGQRLTDTLVQSRDAQMRIYMHPIG